MIAFAGRRFDAARYIFVDHGDDLEARGCNFMMGRQESSAA